MRFSFFNQLFQAFQDHILIALGMIGGFLGTVVVLDEGQPGSISLGRQLVANGLVIFGLVRQLG